MNKAIDADPRVSAAVSTWAGCMADAGYPNLKTVGDAEAAIHDQVQQVQRAAYAGVDESTLTAAKSAELAATVKTQLAPLTPVDLTSVGIQNVRPYCPVTNAK